MAFDKEKFQAQLEKMSADEIRVKLPRFSHKKKLAAIDELAARGRDQELKSWSRKIAARRRDVLYTAVLTVFAVIALLYLALL